jgi:glycosyltransferase involved in cell wall biosynthesis
LAVGDPLADAPFAVTRYIVSQFETAPCNPASEEFRRIEGQGILSNLVPLLETSRPDIVIAGRETFAWHVPAVAHRHGLPCVLLSHGASVWGLIDGSYPPELARRLLDCLGDADRIIAVARHLGQRLRSLGLERVDVIVNAVDPTLFAPGPRDPSSCSAGHRCERIVVTHLSNLKDLKRPLDVVHSAAAPRVPIRACSIWSSATAHVAPQWRPSAHGPVSPSTSASPAGCRTMRSCAT